MINRNIQFIWNEREVSILLPKNYFSSPDQRFPAVITQDGDYLYKRYRVTQPDVIFIGLSPLDRDTEYTPWDAETDVGNYTGEADTYLQMLTQDFIPFLVESYRIDENDFGIAGGSFGALVSLYALLNYGDYFKRYILLSPSLWYPDFLDHIKHSPDILDEKHIFWYVGGAEALGRTNIMGTMVPNNKKAVSLINEKLSHPESQLIFMTNDDGLHRHRFFIRHFTQAVTVYYGK